VYPAHPAAFLGASAKNEQKSLVGWKAESKIRRNRGKILLHAAWEQVLKAAEKKGGKVQAE